MSTEEKAEDSDHIEQVPETPQSQVDDDFKWDLNIVLNLSGLYMSFFSYVWLQFALPISLAFISKAFPTETNHSAWISAVVGLVQCVLSLFVGELSDIFTRRWFIIGGDLLVTIGSIVSSRATSVDMIIGGQVISGFGAAFILLSNPALAEAVPKRTRSVIIAAASGLSGIVGTAGTIAAGAFTKFNVGGVNQGWRVAPYMGAAFAFIAGILCLLFYHPSDRPNPEGLSTYKRLRMIDWFGIFLGTASLTLTLLGLQFGGNPYSWSSAKVLGLLVTGLGCLVIFSLWEGKFVSFGLFPRQLFDHRNFSIVLASQFVEGMAINTSVAFLTEILFTIYTSDALDSQVRNIPFGAATLIGATIWAAIMYYTREAKWVLLAALSVTMLGAGIMSILRPTSSYAAWFFPTAFLGAGVAGMGVSVTVIASVCTPNQFIGTALSLLNSTRGLGAAVGIVIFSQVLQSKLKSKLPAAIAEYTIAAGLPPSSVEALLIAFSTGNPAAYAQVPGVTPAVLLALQKGVKLGYAQSFSYMWYTMLPFVGVTIVLVLFLKPSKPFTTKEVASRVQPRFGHHRHH